VILTECKLLSLVLQVTIVLQMPTSLTEIYSMRLTDVLLEPFTLELMQSVTNLAHLAQADSIAEMKGKKLQWEIVWKDSSANSMQRVTGHTNIRSTVTMAHAQQVRFVDLPLLLQLMDLSNIPVV